MTTSSLKSLFITPDDRREDTEGAQASRDPRLHVFRILNLQHFMLRDVETAFEKHLQPHCAIGAYPSPFRKSEPDQYS